jgi:hypothetical protein
MSRQSRPLAAEDDRGRAIRVCSRNLARRMIVMCYTIPYKRAAETGQADTAAATAKPSESKVRDTVPEHSAEHGAGTYERFLAGLRSKWTKAGRKQRHLESA